MSLNAIDLSAWVIERAIEDVLLNNRFASITDIEKKIKEVEAKGKKVVCPVIYPVIYFPVIFFFIQ